MIKIKKIILALSFILIANIKVFAGQVSAEATDSQIKTGVELLLTQYDWTSFWKEFKISAKIRFCPLKDPTQSLIGIDARLIEPLYLVDVTTKGNYIPALGMTVGKKELQKTGTNLGIGSAMYVNVFKFPLMNMLLKKINSEGIFAFETGNPKLVYIGKIDPKKWNDILSSALNPERSLYATVYGALAGVVSCVANSTLDLLPASVVRDSSVGRSLRKVIDTMYFSLGCGGTIPTGTLVMNESPILAGLLAFTSVLTDMYGKRGITNALDVSHTVKSILNKYDKKIMCRPQSSKVMLPILTQFKTQLIYPTVTKSHELGINPTSYFFRTKGDSGFKTLIFAISQRRDYSAMAYKNVVDEKDPEKEKEDIK